MQSSVCALPGSTWKPPSRHSCTSSTRLAFPRRDFVITDPALLPDEIDDWFPFLSANELDAFGAVAVFRYQD